MSFAVVGPDLVLTFNLKLDGVNATDFDTITSRNGVQTAYQLAGGIRNALSSDADAAVPGDVATPVVLSGGTGGNYTLTIQGGAIYAATDSRYMVRVQNPAGTRAMVLGNYPASPRTDLATNVACQNCHGGVGQGIHYSYPMGVEQCAVCHTADNTTYPRLVELAHGVHNSQNRPSGDWEGISITYPTYMTNCSVCHQDPAALAAANAMPVTGAGCFSCHESMESWAEPFAEENLTFHEAFDEATNCQLCHNDDPVDGIARSTVAAFHNSLETERVGIIWNGEDLSVTEGKKFTWQITNIVDDGVNLAISWTATYNGAPVNPCNADINAGPLFHLSPPGTVLDGSLGILRSYAKGDDFILGKSTSAPGQANNVNLSATNTACAGNVATTTIPVDVTPVDGGVTATRGVVALQGKPQLKLPAGFDNPEYLADVASNLYVRVPTPTREFVVGTGALPAVQRRDVVDTTKCLKCHVGSLYQHGNTRVDNVSMCILCHNSASIDQNNRTTMGVDASEAYDGKPGQTFEMKTMLHSIHSAGETGYPYVVYRTRGIYAWAASSDVLPNWATGAPCTSSTGPGNLVYGADPAVAASCQPHNFHAPTYPQPLNDCAACHADDFDVVPNQSKAVATTLDAGSTVWANQIDDVLQGAGSAACTTCHRSSDAKAHAAQNGWTPQAFPNGRQTILDAATD